jgi:hypothetical protein
MEFKKTLFKTIICLSTVILLTACDDDNDKPQVSVTDDGLNCSSALGTYTVTDVIEAGGDEEEDVTEITTIDIGSNCSFTLHSETLGTASGTLTASNGHTYTGTGTSQVFCGGTFDFSVIVNNNVVSYVLECN